MIINILICHHKNLTIFFFFFMYQVQNIYKRVDPNTNSAIAA